MTDLYTYATTLTWGGDEPTAEINVEVSYTVAWGSPECGRGYMADPALYDPGSPDEVEDIKLLTVEGKPRPWDMGYGFLPDDAFEQDVIEKLSDHEDAMIREATDIEHARNWAAIEDRDERRRLEREP